jgi:hypothetical protein
VKIAIAFNERFLSEKIAFATSKRRLASEASRAKKFEALVAMGTIVRLRLNFGGKTKCLARKKTGWRYW